MKKFLTLAFALLLGMQTLQLNALPAYADGSSKLDQANKEIKALIGIDNFYKTQTKAGALNASYTDKGIGGTDYPIFAYGSQEEASRKATTNKNKPYVSGGQYRCLGYTQNGGFYTNPDFPDDYAMEKYADNKRFVEKPWEDKNIALVDAILKNKFSDFNMDNLAHMGVPSDYYRKNIAMGVGLQYGLYWGKSMRNEPPTNLKAAINQLEGNYKGNMVNGKYRTLEWEKYTFIIQPPTSKSWGTGVVFHINKENKPRYFTIPLVPFDIVEGEDDLSVTAKPGITKATPDQQVTVAMNIASSFATDVETVYTWEVKDADGTVLSTTTYGGATPAATGRIKLKGSPAATAGATTAAPKPAEATATFTMPQKDAYVTLTVNNKQFNDPIEKNTKNNTATVHITSGALGNKFGKYDLPFNVLSLEIATPINEGKGSNAKLTKPSNFKEWTANMTGSLELTRKDPKNHLGNYDIRKNDLVDGPYEEVNRTPVISAQVHRESFGDDPEGKKFVNLQNPWAPLKGNSAVSFAGSVSRPYIYTETITTNSGTEVVERKGVLKANFETGTEGFDYNVFVYNGKKVLPQVPNRTFKKEITGNKYATAKRGLLWISDPYNLNVLRWMVNKKVTPNPDQWVKVDGQFQRVFTEQNSGSIEFVVKNSMASIYKADREAAKKGVNQKSSYPNIVFPTDKDLQKFAYPIKSGYYFTPRGEYQIKIKTDIYKDVNANTKEHAELVKKTIEAFHFQSDLEFTVDGKNKYSINLSKKYGKVQNKEMLGFKTAFNKKVEELAHSEDSNGFTDNRIKAILEGYKESGTQPSKDSFLYREYLKDAHKLYKVSEETVITVTVNPSKTKLYTRSNMPDYDKRGGAYYMRAWLEDIEFNGLKIYTKANKNGQALDGIDLHVKGSMYDDLNN